MLGRGQPWATRCPEEEREVYEDGRVAGRTAVPFTQIRSRQPFPVMGQKANALGFVDRVVSATIIQLCC